MDPLKESIAKSVMAGVRDLISDSAAIDTENEYELTEISQLVCQLRVKPKNGLPRYFAIRVSEVL